MVETVSQYYVAQKPYTTALGSWEVEDTKLMLICRFNNNYIAVKLMLNSDIFIVTLLQLYFDDLLLLMGFNTDFTVLNLLRLNW